jgi:hypothetical protein
MDQVTSHLLAMLLLLERSRAQRLRSTVFSGLGRLPIHELNTCISKCEFNVPPVCDGTLDSLYTGRCSLIQGHGSVGMVHWG